MATNTTPRGYRYPDGNEPPALDVLLGHLAGDVDADVTRVLGPPGTQGVRVVAEAYQPAVVVLASLTDVASVTITAVAGVPIYLHASGMLTNRNSGADRTASIQLEQDGVVINGAGAAVLVSLPFTTGANRGVGWTFNRRLTPTAGAHTYRVRVSASAASSVGVDDTVLRVTTGGRW